MAVRIPWDKYEAALLLDTYEKIEMGLISRKDAVSNLSANLRSKAIQSGNIIDEMYRNENGISLQLNNMMNAATNGQKGLPCSTKLFFDIVQLKHDNPNEYYQILHEATRMIMHGDDDELTSGIEHTPGYDSCSDEKNSDSARDRFVSNMAWDILEYLSFCELEYIDNSSKGGCIWVIGGRELTPIIEEAQKHGFAFRFQAYGGKATGGRAAWWTKPIAKSDCSGLVEQDVDDDQSIAGSQGRHHKMKEDCAHCTDPVDRQQCGEPSSTDESINRSVKEDAAPNSDDETSDMDKIIEDEDNMSFSIKLGVAPDLYKDITLDEIDLTPRAYNILRRRGAKTLADILAYSPASLRELRGLGAKSYEDIIEKMAAHILKGMPTDSSSEPSDGILGHSIRRPDNNELAFCKARAIEICNGDFTWAAGANLTDKQTSMVMQYKESYAIIGKDLAHEALEYTPAFHLMTEMFGDFIYESEIISRQRNELRNRLQGIPEERWWQSSWNYLRIFARTDADIAIATELSERCPRLIDFVEKNELLPPDHYKWLCKVIDKASFDIHEEIRDLTGKLFKKPRDRTVLTLRAEGKTLEATGQVIHVTRERVRQIEVNLKRIFNYWQSRKRYLMRISALRNGDDILTVSELQPYLGDNANELLYLFKMAEDPAYYYDEQLDGFVIGDSSIGTRVQEFIESLPDTFSVDKLASYIEKANEDYDIPDELLLPSIKEIYSLTGSIYHRNRLSRMSMYKSILESYFADGMHIYDDDALAEFRRIIQREYGDVHLPSNNRAISVRLADIGILCGRGLYCPKKEKYISEDLAEKIAQYIEDSPVGIIFFATLFLEFEGELREFGINNRYYLQGVLKELFGDRYFFRRDYISRNSADPSLYSDIVQFIKDSPYPVSKAEIQAVYPGITDVVISLAVMDSEVLSFYGKYLHASNLDITQKDKQMLRQTVKKIVSDRKPHHIKEIFLEVQQANGILLSRNAVLWPHCLYSVLAYLFEDEFNFERPFVAMKEVTIDRAPKRIRDSVRGKDIILISDLIDMAKEAYFSINSILEFLNSFNETHLLADGKTLVAIESIGVDADLAGDIERKILEEMESPVPIASLQCVHQLKTIGVPWTDWLIYSVLKKWAHDLDVESSNKYFKYAMPIVGPKGSITTEVLANYTAREKVEMTAADNLDNIDELIADFTLEDWEDI